MVVDNGLMDSDGGVIGVKICKWIGIGCACAVDSLFPIEYVIIRRTPRFQPFCLIIELSLKSPCIGAPTVRRVRDSRNSRHERYAYSINNDKGFANQTSRLCFLVAGLTRRVSARAHSTSLVPLMPLYPLVPSPTHPPSPAPHVTWNTTQEKAMTQCVDMHTRLFQPAVHDADACLPARIGIACSKLIKPWGCMSIY